MKPITLILTLALVACSGATAAPQCLEATDCGPSEVCAAGACTDALGASYALVVEAATALPEVDVTNRHWDPEEMAPACSPDPFAIVLVEAADWGCVTDPVADSLDPVWGHACELELAFGAEPLVVVWEVYDSDPGGAPDELLAAGEGVVTVEALRAGGVVLAASVPHMPGDHVAELQLGLEVRP